MAPTKLRPTTATREPQGIFWFIDQFHKSIYFSFQILEARCESIAWSCWEVSWNTMVEQHVLTIRNEGGSLQFPLSCIIIACGWKSKICRTFNQWRLGICWIWQEKNTKCRPVKIYGNTFWLQNVGTVQNSQPMIYKNLQEGFRLVDPLMNVRPNATLKRSSFHVQPPCQGSKSLNVSVLTKHSSFGVDVVPVSLAAEIGRGNWPWLPVGDWKASATCDTIVSWW